nr:unnamed protein product [Callosobruchus analis]
MLDGTVLKKYKMRTKLSTVMKFQKSSTYNSKDIMSFERKKSEYIRRNNIIKQKIKDFLELEDNSRVCPGKKEFVKKNKVKKQKRFLSNTLKNLHQKFLIAYPNVKYNGCIRLQYFQWVHLTQNYFDKKTQTVKRHRKIAKQPNDVEAAELVTIFMNKLPILLSHEGRVLHQHHSISELKKKLKANEIIVHCDFSENYSMKYAEEIQAFHFGGARQQITLHTVVVYTKYESETVPESYCTLSESLNHGPAAIWAHLRPILTNYTQNGINTIHFLSDSPATQYRNKEMFCFITNHFKKHFPEVKELSWNYHEAGHGKGAPDGIGGVCKRTADRVVSQGKDIFNLETLVNVLKECCPGISFYVISATDIEKFTSIISKQSSLAFKGTLKVHQVLPVKNKLYLRSLSCFTCRDFCNHFDLGSLAYENSFTSSESNEDSEEELPLSIFLQNKSKAPSQKLMFSDVYSDDEVPTCSYSSSIRAKTGNYVLVSIKSVNKKLAVEYRYVAVCQSDFQEGEIKVAFLKLSDCEKGDLFKMGEENDVSFIQEEQILEVLPEPNLIIKGHRIYYKFPHAISVFETA